MAYTPRSARGLSSVPRLRVHSAFRLPMAGHHEGHKEHEEIPCVSLLFRSALCIPSSAFCTPVGISCPLAGDRSNHESHEYAKCH